MAIISAGFPDDFGSFFANLEAARRLAEQTRYLDELGAHARSMDEAARRVRSFTDAPGFQLMMDAVRATEQFGRAVPDLSFLNEVQQIARFHERLTEGFPVSRKALSRTVREELPDLSAEEAEIVSEAVDAHLPAVLERIAGGVGAEQAAVRAQEALRALYERLAARLTGPQLERVWSGMQGVILLVLALVTHSIDQEALRLDRRQTEIAEEQLRDSQQDSERMEAQRELAEQSLDVQSEHLQLARQQAALNQERAEAFAAAQAEMIKRLESVEALVAETPSQDRP
jgi:hypothetical protein